MRPFGRATMDSRFSCRAFLIFYSTIIKATLPPPSSIHSVSAIFSNRLCRGKYPSTGLEYFGPCFHYNCRRNRLTFYSLQVHNTNFLRTWARPLVWNASHTQKKPAFELLHFIRESIMSRSSLNKFVDDTETREPDFFLF